MIEKIEPWNKIHVSIVDRELTKNPSLAANEDFFYDRSYLWRIYGRFSPSPLGSLALSDELPLLHYLIQAGEREFAYSDLAFLYRRLGNFELAIHYAKKSINYEAKVDVINSKLELAISFFLSQKNHEAKKVICELILNKDHREISAIQYWYHRINVFNKDFKFNELLCHIKTNPLLIVDYLKQRSKDKYDFLYQFKTQIDQYDAVFDQECLIFFLIDEGFFNKTTLNPRPHVSSLLKDFVRKWKCEISLRSSTLDQLVLVFGKRETLELISTNGAVPLTSELMDRVFSLYPIFNSFLTSPNIDFRQSKNFIDVDGRYAEVIKNIMYQDYVLRDANTSSYQSRFYSLNLRMNKGIHAFILQELSETLDYSFHKMKEKFLEIGVDIGEEYELWFDASYTYGGSKINNHLHTASYDRSYLNTAVLYLCVPETGLDEGRIVIHSQGKDVSILPQTGDIASFPPWFWHETTPILAGDLRITLNVDILSKKKIHLPLSLFC